MAVIFYGSTGVLAASKTKGFLAPLLESIFPWASEAVIHGMQVGIRKCGHLTEYGILAILVWRAVRNLREGVDRSVWGTKDARLTIAICALYAASDEWHQSFNPLRGASVVDVGIDTLGAALALLVVWWFGKWRGWWKPATSIPSDSSPSLSAHE